MIRLIRTIFLCLMAFPFSVAAEPSMRVVFLGDSLTAGYALDLDQAYPALIQKKIEAEGLPFRVINSGISGDTTAGGLRRLDWLMRQPVAVIIIALGANDGLRGFPPRVPEENLSAIIEKVRSASPSTRVLLAGIQLPDNMGPDYLTAFDAVFPRVARKYKVPLLPFLLKGVAGNPDLNLPDGIHPNEAGQRIVAQNVWAWIAPTLRELAEKPRPAN